MARGKKKEELTLEEKLERALVPVEEQPYEVPENWCWTKLRVVSEVVTGSTPSKKKPEYYGEEFPFFKPADLDAGRKTIIASEYLSNEGKKISRVIPAKSTAVCCIGSIGKSGYLEVDGATNQQINSVIPKINSLYLYYFINTEMFINELWEKSSATTISIVNKSKMEQNLVPLPPLEEQQRIVEQIESLFAKLDEAKEKVQFVRNCCDDDFSSVVHEALTGNLTEEWRVQNGLSRDGWKKSKLGNLGSLERGRSKHRPRNDPRLFGGSYPFIQTGDVAEADVYIEKHKQTLSEFGLAQSRMFSKGTLCITIAANIGDVAILSYDCCFPDSVVGFTPCKDVESKYIYYMMSELQKEIEANAPATAQKNINLKILNDIDIIIPSVIEQREIIAILDDLYDKKRQVKEKTEQIVDAIDMMKKSILTKAFRGELGTNNPEEESAIKLLKKILVET